MIKQVRNSFDKETIRKIVKGAVIAMVVALLLYLTDVFSVMDFGWAPAVVWLLQVALNAVREYRQGQ